MFTFHMTATRCAAAASFTQSDRLCLTNTALVVIACFVGRARPVGSKCIDRRQALLLGGAGTAGICTAIATARVGRFRRDAYAVIVPRHLISDVLTTDS
eukprot:6204858-Pleurochrysis_carterae.AAC.2